LSIVIASIGTSRGVHKKLEHLDENEGRSGDLDWLRDGGFDGLIQCDSNFGQMILDATQACLESAAIAPDDIDAVVIATESFWDFVESKSISERFPAHFRPREVLTRIVMAAGLRNAQLYGNWLSGCSNFGSSMLLARSLILSQTHRRVLVVVGDRVPLGASRIMGDSIAAYGDGASACLVTGEGRGYQVKSLATHPAPSLLGTEDAGDIKAHGKAFNGAMETFASKIELKVGRPPATFERIVTDNLHSDFLSAMLTPMRVEMSQVSTPSKAHWGHAFSADCLLSLEMLSRSAKIETGSAIGLINFGTLYFAFLEVVPV